MMPFSIEINPDSSATWVATLIDDFDNQVAFGYAASPHLAVEDMMILVRSIAEEPNLNRSEGYERQVQLAREYLGLPRQRHMSVQPEEES